MSCRMGRDQNHYHCSTGHSELIKGFFPVKDVIGMEAIILFCQVDVKHLDFWMGFHDASNLIHDLHPFVLDLGEGVEAATRRAIISAFFR